MALSQQEIFQLKVQAAQFPKYKKNFQSDAYNAAYQEWMNDDGNSYKPYKQDFNKVDFGYYNSANWQKIANKIGIKNIDSTNDLDQMYKYVNKLAMPGMGGGGSGGATKPPAQKPYSPQKLNVKSTASGAPAALSAPAPKAFNDAPYLASIADLKKQLQAQTTLSQQNTQNFQQNLAAMQNQMSANMASYQKSLSDQNLAFSQQMTDMETQNQQSMQLMAQQMAPQEGAQVLGVKTASGPSTMAQQLRRAGMRGSFNRAGLRIKSLNV